MTVERKKVKGLHGFVIYEVVRVGYDFHYYFVEVFENFYKAKDYFEAYCVLGGRRFVLVEYK